MKKYIVLLIILTVSLLSCTSDSENKGKIEVKKINYELIIKEKVKEWNNAHNFDSKSDFLNIYNVDVDYYGRQKTSHECILNKNIFLKKSEGFHQQIFGEIDLERIDSNTIKCVFIKRVTLNFSTKDYPSYLIYKKQNNEWRISTESDLVTDKNVAKSKIRENAVNEKNYLFEPNISTISGKIVTRTYYGRPNFGDTPSIDEKITVHQLSIRPAISVISTNRKDEYNSTTHNVRNIQLLSTKGIKMSVYLNKRVILNGTFFTGHTGHHHTDILMNVSSVTKIE